MNILLINGLPEDIDGVPISPDFRNMISVELLLNDESIPIQFRSLHALELLYPEVPEDIQKALNDLRWFFNRGEPPKDDEGRSVLKNSRGYDFEKDADYIYASFCSAYGVRLAEVDYMHWWEFLALFHGLPEDTIIKKIIYWRTCDISKLSKNEKANVLKMRKAFALTSASAKPMTIEELNRKTQEYYNSRTKGDSNGV